MKNPKDIVREGYDQVSLAYRGNEMDTSDEIYQQYKAWTDEILFSLKKDSFVLDLGCGCGLPSTKLLSKTFNVIGVDISPVQIRRAKNLVPNATFVCGDMCKLEFDKEKFEAIVSFYAIIHVPEKEQPKLLSRIWQWLKPEGYFLFSAGNTKWTGREGNWLGVEGGNMYWSHADKETYLYWLKMSGFDVIWDRFIPDGPGGHVLFFANKNENR